MPQTINHECGGYESLESGPENVYLIVQDDRLVRVGIYEVVSERDVPFVTDRGIAPGSTVAAVRDAYPGSERVEVPDFEGTEDQIRVDSEQSVMIFSVNESGNTVDQVRVSLPGHENPRSGCL